MNIPSHLTQAEAKVFLQRQMATGRYMILGTVIITVVNLIALLTGGNFYINYCAAAGFYPVWLGQAMDGLESFGIYTRTGLAAAVVVLGAYLALWALCKRWPRCLEIAMGLLALDTLILFFVAFGLTGGGIADILWELVLHGAVLYEMGKAVSARKQLPQLQQELEPEPVA